MDEIIVPHTHVLLSLAVLYHYMFMLEGPKR